ncbi:MAG TPA: MFS transporter [Solirubrobacteraceae bacterium]|nr:MFS transporter [Solirubrobacteraceae bacterium]
MSDQRARPAEFGAGISRPLVMLLALTCGAAVANLYYAQPLLHTIAHAFSVSSGTAGLLVTVSQAGYVVGLALLVPLGDLLERRALITAMLLIAALGLGLAGAAPSFTVFALAVALLGVTSVVAQIVVAMSSSLAGEHERGRVVGTVMSGLLIGILSARIVSGIVAQLFGWRVIFVLAAVEMVLLAVVLRVRFPPVPTTEQLSYPELLRSVVRLIRGEPLLRQRMLIGATAFGCFSILWTSVAFMLAGPPYHYGNAAIGLFGLAGLAGALVAPVAGRLSDHGRGRLAMSGSIVVLLVSWGLLAFGQSSLPALIAGIVLLDLGAQAMHISNQSAVYSLHGQARSRLTTAYMVAYFSGGVALSAATSALYSSGGWAAVCALGAGTAALGLVVWLVTERAASSARRVGQQEPA